ncbi:MAG: lectin [Hyphomicrobium sp.]
MKSICMAAMTGLILALSAPMSHAQQQPPTMGFFVTSVGIGNGGNLGGLEGADAHCQALAEAAGAGNREWRAYLSTEEPDKRGVFARHRIGAGPWYNARGELIAVDLDNLHISPNIFQRTALDEKGNDVKGRYHDVNEHDMLTGTQVDGTPYWPDDKDHTCNNWTSSGDGSAQVGHHDRHGGGNTSWNSAHPSRGCSQEALQSTGGAGLFYCFAAD